MGVWNPYILAHFLGRPCSLRSLEKVRQSGEDPTLSVRELKDFANRYGIDLQTQIFRRNQRSLDRPAIAFLQLPGEGHFVVVRPIGSQGRMVQMIDSGHVPQVMDYEQLFSIPAWTGVILIPRSFSERTLPWFGAVAASVGSFVALKLARKR